MIGIYCIQNLLDGKKYIGQSRNVESRIRQHKSTLNYGYCHVIHLQRAWNKYGEENFLFYILEECPLSELDERETWYINSYNTTNMKFGYNTQGGGYKNKIITEETRMRMSASKIGHFVPDEVRKKISKSNRGKKLSEQSRENISKGHLGIRFTDEQREKMSDSCSKKVWAGFVSPSGEMYENITNLGRFCREHGLDYTAMRVVSVGGKNKTYKGWKPIK